MAVDILSLCLVFTIRPISEMTKDEANDIVGASVGYIAIDVVAIQSIYAIAFTAKELVSAVHSRKPNKFEHSI
jgi:hypothetical protein